MHPLLVAAYLWTEIIIPNAPMGSAFGPNDKGQVAVSNADGTKTGIWQHGKFTPLPPPPAGYTVGAIGINNAGVIVGNAFATPDTHEQGFILAHGQYTFFARPGWDNTEARAIADSGLITGYSANDVDPDTAGFIYDPATNTFTDAKPPASFGFSITQGMNVHGRISGDGRVQGLGRYGFVWQQGTVIEGNRALAPFLARSWIGDGGTAARGINDEDFITGFTFSGGVMLGFVGNATRGYQLLMPPGGDAAGATTACEGINNFRQVACQVTDADSNTRAFIGTPPWDGP
jgi:hypothetical protein